MPAMVASASGVSCTRSLPKRSCRPAVGRNPPPLAPTSWPITTTSASCCISQPCAMAMASTMVIFANSMTAGLGAVFAGDEPLLMQVRGECGKQMFEHCIGRWLHFPQILGHRRVDLDRAVFQQGLFLGGIPESGIGQESANPQQRFKEPGILDLLARPIAAGVIRSRVIAQSVCQRLDHGRARAAPRGLERLADHLPNGEDVVAVDLHPRN